MFEAIWNCRKLFGNNISKEWILTMFERIWNCREKNLKTMYLKHAFWRYWKWFGTAKKTLITRTLNGSFWRLTIVETIWNFREKIKNIVSKACIGTGCETSWNCRKNENKDGKWCILTVFKIIWNCYVQTCGCSLLTPIGIHFLLHFWIFWIFDFQEKL